MKINLTLSTAVTLFITTLLMTACNGKTDNTKGEETDSIVALVPDTALYGTVGEGTTMYVLELKSMC